MENLINVLAIVLYYLVTCSIYVVAGIVIYRILKKKRERANKIVTCSFCKTQNIRYGNGKCPICGRRLRLPKEIK